MKLNIVLEVDGLPDDLTPTDSTLGTAAFQAGRAAAEKIHDAYPDRVAAGDVQVKMCPEWDIAINSADFEPAAP